MTLDEFQNSTSTHWKEKYQAFTIDMTKNRYRGRYRLGLISIIVPTGNPF